MKKILQLILKAGVSFVLIWYLLSKTDFSDVYASLKSAQLNWLALAFITLYVGKILTGYRWQKLLEAQEIRIPLKTLIASIFVGQFFNTFLPTTVGGDAMRAYDTAVHSKQSAKSVTTVFADRLIGVFALAVLAILGIVIGYVIGEDVSFFVGPAVMVFGLCAGAFLLIFSHTLTNMFESLMQRLKMGKVASKFKKASLSLQILKDDKHVLFVAFAISVALQINVVLFYYFIAVSLSMGVSVLYFFIITPVALVVLLVPFSINGIGIREGIFVFLLSTLTVPSETAIALSWLSFGLVLTQGVTGGLIFAFRGISFKQLKLSRTGVRRKKVVDV